MRTELTRSQNGVRVVHRCAQCRHSLDSTVGLRLLDHSAVVAFHREHGIDLCATPYWELPWCVDTEHTTVRSIEPWDIEVTIPLGGERLHLALDGDLTVTDIDRTERTSTETKQTA